MTNTDNRSSDDIEREVESTRARVTETLEELRSRMTPGQIVDQFVDYARESGGGDFVRNLGQAVRDNPLPVLLIGAGISWLMFSGSTAGRSGRGAMDEDYDDDRDRSYGRIGGRGRSSYGPGGVAGYGAHEGTSGFAKGSTGGTGRGAYDMAGRDC